MDFSLYRRRDAPRLPGNQGQQLVLLALRKAHGNDRLHHASTRRDRIQVSRSRNHREKAGGELSNVDVFGIFIAIIVVFCVGFLVGMEVAANCIAHELTEKGVAEIRDNRRITGHVDEKIRGDWKTI